MKKIFYSIAAVAAAALLASCQDALVINTVNEADYANVSNLVISVRDGNTFLAQNTVEMTNPEGFDTQVVISLPRPAQQGLDVQLCVDPEYVATYNKINKTSFEALNAELVSFQNEGKVVIAPDQKTSYGVKMHINYFEVNDGKTFVLPVKATVAQQGVKVAGEELVYLVSNKGLAMATRTEGQKSIFCYFEVNDTNPLNVLQWETESGQLLIDYLVLFAYNINYDKEKGEVYCFPNPQCQYILDHYDEVIKPIRERGVKVLIGLLGNHDESGCAQLSKLGAQQMAQKMAAICYGYGFDGINFDDEYSNSPDLTNPLFASRSYAAGDRLIFECKRAMPDLLMTSYQYGMCQGRNAVDGILPGDYLDITVADYGTYAATAFEGMTNAQCSYTSSEFAQSRALPTASSVEAFTQAEQGFWMIFAPWGSGNQGGQKHFNTLNILAEGILGSPLKKPAYYYPETKSLETKPITW